MRNKILLIVGFGGSGKTTVASRVLQAQKAVLFSIRMWMMPTLDCEYGAKGNAKLSVGGEAYKPSSKTLTFP